MTPHGRIVTRGNTLKILETIIGFQNKVTAIHMVSKAVPSEVLKDRDTYVPEYEIKFEFHVPPYGTFMLHGQGKDIPTALQALISEIDTLLAEQQEGLAKQKTEFGQQLAKALRTEISNDNAS
jgi:hypothetical protein